jgi:hypothetical protein
MIEINPDEIFRKNRRVLPFKPQINGNIVVEFKLEPVEEKLRK